MSQEAIAARTISGANRTATRALLAGGAFAAPLFLVVALVEIFTRPGFDLRRNELSLLSNGDLGWIQIASFVATGLLAIAAAIGMRPVLAGRASTWGPILIGIFGLGYVGAGLFVADPMNGFPPGTPAGPPVSASWHSWMHLVSGSIAFLALIGACFVFARRFSGARERGWMAYSVISGLIVLVGVVAISSGAQNAALIIGFFVTGVLGLTWLSALSLRFVLE